MSIFSQKTFAVEDVQKNCVDNTCPVQQAISPLETKSEEAKIEIKQFVEKFELLQNKHSLMGLKKLYTDEFVNSDGYNKEQLFKLMKSTFENYPDIKFEFEIENIVVSGDYAFIYLKQNISATTKSVSKITGDKGDYTALLNVVLYLKKINSDWKIYSEAVLYENSRLAFGSAKSIDSILNVPQKVLSNTDYCAGVRVVLPEKYMATASINNTQIVEGFNLKGETFRSVANDDGIVERMLKANADKNNEAVVISIALTEKTQDMFKKPKIEISGLLMLMKRVDVIPTNSNTEFQKDK